MEFAYALVVIALVNFTGWITPGPNMVAVMSASMSLSRKHGYMTGAGMGLAALVWSALAMMGLTTLFEVYPDFALGLKLIGALYLIWLGVKAFQSSTSENTTLNTKNVPSQSMGKCFQTGFLVSMTNPKAALFFGSVLTAFVPLGAPIWFSVTIVFFCGAFSAMLHMITASVFSTQVSMKLFARFRKRIETLFGMIFVGSGLAIFASAFSRNS